MVTVAICGAIYYAGWLALEASPLSLTEAADWLHAHRLVPMGVGLLLLALVLARTCFARSRQAELVFGAFFVGESVIEVLFDSGFAAAWRGHYEGSHLMAMALVMILGLALLLLTAIGFLLGRLWSAWALTASLLLLLATQVAPVTPNGPEYERLLRELDVSKLQIMDRSLPSESAAVGRVVCFPESVNYAVYLLAGVYISARCLRERRG